MIIVTGAEGMLGRHVTEALQGLKQNVLPLTHRQFDITDLAHLTKLGWGEGDVIINCAGVINEKADALQMVQANTLGPHTLAHASRKNGFRLIHISTDCVFSSLDRHSAPTCFRENNQPCPDTRSLYGRTKLAGEPNGPGVTVIRTSFAGPDHGLWHWLANVERDAMIEGWRNSWWSGSTVAEVANMIALNVNRFTAGTIHLATEKPITKLEACKELLLFLGRDDVRLLPSGTGTDRSLAPTRPFVLRSFAEALHG